MKKTIKKSIVLIIITSVVLLFLSACSGVLGGDNVVRISVSQLADQSSGRFISGTATNGYVVVLKKDKIYSLNSFEGDAYNYLVNGEVYIVNLPPGDYIFGIALLDDEDKDIGFAVKERTITRGFNDVSITVSPGITSFSVDEISEDPLNPFVPPSGVYVEFSEDTIILDYGRGAESTPLVAFSVSFGGSPSVTFESAVAIDGDLTPVTGGYRVSANSDGIVWKYRAEVGSVTQDYEYHIILK